MLIVIVGFFTVRSIILFDGDNKTKNSVNTRVIKVDEKDLKRGYDIKTLKKSEVKINPDERAKP